MENVFLSEKEEYVRGHAELKWELSLNIFYHSTSLKFNFALHNNKERLWAIDWHKPVGWHRHPLGDVTEHEPIDPMEVEGIVAELEAVILRIQK